MVCVPGISGLSLREAAALSLNCIILLVDGMREKLQTLASDTIVYGTSTIVQRFLTFLLTPLYTNFLTRQELGDVITLYSLIAFVNVLYAFGFESAFLRFYRRDADDRHSVFSHSAAIITLISLAFSLLVYACEGLILRSSSLGHSTSPSIFHMAILIPLFDALTIIPYAQLRMERKARRFAGTKLVVVAINVIANLLFVVQFHRGAAGVFEAGIVSSFVGLCFFLPTLIRHLRFRWNTSLLRQLSSFGLPTLPSGFSAIMLQVADRPILYAMTDASTVGLYSANYRLGIPMMLFASVFEYAWKPFYLSHADDPDAKSMFSRVFTYFSLVCALIFLLVSFFIGNIVQMPFIGGHFIREDYWVGLGIVPIVAAAYYFTGVATNFAAGLHITKNTKYLPIATGAAALSNIVLNLLLIPLLSYIGAAWATLGAYLISAAVMYVYAQRVYRINYEWRRLVLLLVCTVAASVLSRFVTSGAALTEFGLHLGIIALFLALLAVFGFFSASEQQLLRALISRKQR